MIKNRKKIILALAVYNSFSNLQKIFLELKKSKFNKYINDVIIIDNNSELNTNIKINLIKRLSFKFKKKIKFIINKKNYGLGGSQKILFRILKKNKFDYFINAHTSGRYKIIRQLEHLEKIEKFDYIVGSRFNNKRDSKNFNFIRKIANIFFQKITSLVSSNKLNDPGMAIYLMSNKLFLKVYKDAMNLTNYSHFNHLLNVLIQSKTTNIFVYRLKWKDGNIKSHLNPSKYVFVLSLSLAKFLLTGNFFKEKISIFKYQKFFFKN